MGEKRRRRDETASFEAQALIARENDLRTNSIGRWPGVVGALRDAVREYNEGVGHQVLVVVEGSDRQRPDVTIESTACPGSTLAVVLEDAQLHVARRAEGGVNDAKWLDLTRTDEDTAAYVLQDWMARI